MREAKQVIVIRRDLGMRRGKEIAQGSHASMAWLTRRLHGGERYAGAFGCQRIPVLSGDFTEAELAWVQGSFAKVVCQVQSEEELRELHKAATEAGLEAHLITDSGRTEFHGEPTVTALAIGPDWSEKIDPVTSHLRLY